MLTRGTAQSAACAEGYIMLPLILLSSAAAGGFNVTRSAHGIGPETVDNVVRASHFPSYTVASTAAAAIAPCKIVITIRNTCLHTPRRLRDRQQHSQPVLLVLRVAR